MHYAKPFRFSITLLIALLLGAASLSTPPQALANAERALIPRDPKINETSRINGSNTTDGDFFGASVAASGTTIIVGAPSSNSSNGTAYIKIRSGSSYSEQAILTAATPANEQFGSAVAIDGDTAVIGAYGASSGQGAVYIFTRSGAVWSQQARLTASDAANNDYLGYAVAISGDTVMAGAYGKSGLSGRTYAFTRLGTAWSQQAILALASPTALDFFGYSVSISGDSALIGAYGTNSQTGSAYVFTRSGTAWSQQAVLNASDPVAGDYFGNTVSLQGTTALIGAQFKNNLRGAAYVYVFDGSIWSQQQKLTASDGADGDTYGVAVTLEGNTALIGSPSANGYTGRGYVYTRVETTWAEGAKLNITDSTGFDSVGNSVALSYGVALAGTPGNALNAGAVYSYVPPLAPTVVASLGTTPILVGGTTTLRYTISNPNAGTALNGLTFTSTISGNITIASGTPANTCTAGTVTATTGSSTFNVTGVALAVSATCYVEVNITSTVAGTWTAQANAPTTTEWTLLPAASNIVSLVVNAPTSTPTATFTSTATATKTATSTPTTTRTPTATPVPITDTIGIYRPSNNTFYLRKSNNTGFADITITYGSGPNLLPAPGDWNGDGIDTVGVYNTANGNYQLTNSQNPAQNGADYQFTFGIPNDTPLVGKWDNTMNNDGVGVYRPSNGILYLKRTFVTGFADYAMVLGVPSDQGIAGDWNGDGISNVGVFRPSEGRFYLSNTNGIGVIFGDFAFYYGANGHKAFTGNWAGLGYSGVGVFIPSYGIMALRNTLTTGYADNLFPYGINGDLPVAGRWTASAAPNRLNMLVNPNALPTLENGSSSAE